MAGLGGLGEIVLEPVGEAVGRATVGGDQTIEFFLRGLQRGGGVFDRLRRLYPFEGGISALRPDALGEQLVAETLNIDDELIDAVLGKDSPAEHAWHALTVLTRLARRDFHERKWLERALRDYLGSREQEVRKVGEETGAPMDEMLAAALRAAPRPTRVHVVNAQAQAA